MKYIYFICNNISIRKKERSFKQSLTTHIVIYGITNHIIIKKKINNFCSLKENTRIESKI